MIKKFITVALLIISIIILCTPYVHADRFYYNSKWTVHNENVKLYIDGNRVSVDVPPLILSGRTLVPVRAFFEKLGADVQWNQALKKVTIVYGSYKVTLIVDNYEADVNGKKVILDVPAKMVNDINGVTRTLVPVRFISSQLGFDVSWDGQTQSVYVKKQNTNASSGNSITGFSADATSITINTSTKSAPVVSKIANPSRLVLDFYGFALKTGDGKLGISGNCFSDVRYAAHPDYTRVVIDITGEYKYELKITNNSCVVYILGENEQFTPPEQDNVEESLPVNPTGGGNGMVVIDPGHGGSDPGAVGYKDGEVHVKESVANLDISLKLYEILKNQGIEVSLTRTTDMYVSLKDRAEYANNLNATLFICIHNNSATIESANGSMVYYFTGEGDSKTKAAYGITSKELAALIQKPLIEYGGRYDRQIADGSQLYVLRNTTMPAVLVECAFLSNNEERELLNTDEFKQALAEGIAVGVINGLKQTGKFK